MRSRWGREWLLSKFDVSNCSAILILGADVLPSTAQCSCQSGAVVASLLLLLQREDMLEVSCQVELSLLKFRGENPMLNSLSCKGK